jgi:hypothetical protein
MVTICWGSPTRVGCAATRRTNRVFDHLNAPAGLRAAPVAGPRGAEYARLNGRAGTGSRVAQSNPLAVSVNRATVRPGDILVATVHAIAGDVATPVDAYAVVETPAGGWISLQTDGPLQPGLVPIARAITLPTVTSPFVFPIPAGTPAGLCHWIAGLTTPGTLSLVWPLVSTPFTIAP